MTTKKSQKKFIILAIITLGIGFCFYTASQPRKVEWEANNPQLHGQTITFDLPLAYRTVVSEVYFGAEGIPYENLLRVDRPNITESSKKGKWVEIDNGAKFKISRSFWIRKNWWEKGFASETRHLVLEDQSGTKSVLAFWDLRYSSRPDLEK